MEEFEWPPSTSTLDAINFTAKDIRNFCAQWVENVESTLMVLDFSHRMRPSNLISEFHRCFVVPGAFATVCKMAENFRGSVSECAVVIAFVCMISSDVVWGKISEFRRLCIQLFSMGSRPGLHYTDQLMRSRWHYIRQKAQ